MRKNKFAGTIPVITAVIIAVTASVFTGGCAKANKTGEKADRDLVEIREKMFIAQVNDVYLNPAIYLGKTLRLEGIFKRDQSIERNTPFYSVIRYGAGGCCGNDGQVGFEVKWPEDRAGPYPVADSWVEATGVVNVGNEDGNNQYLYLDLSSLTVLNRWGAEYVVQ